MKFKLNFILFISFLFLFEINAQTDNFISECEEYLQLPFISDGHDYSIELKKNDKGEFKTTFYGGSTYRIISCSNLPQGKVIYKIYDKEKNLLFSNSDYNYSKYWDFQFKSTIDCTIEVKFESEMVNKAQIQIMIAFKSQ